MPATVPVVGISNIASFLIRDLSHAAVPVPAPNGTVAQGSAALPVVGSQGSAAPSGLEARTQAWVAAGSEQAASPAQEGQDDSPNPVDANQHGLGPIDAALPPARPSDDRPLGEDRNAERLSGVPGRLETPDAGSGPADLLAGARSQGSEPQRTDDPEKFDATAPAAVVAALAFFVGAWRAPGAEEGRNRANGLPCAGQ
jgi:hypothetical protein